MLRLLLLKTVRKVENQKETVDLMLVVFNRYTRSRREYQGRFSSITVSCSAILPDCRCKLKLRILMSLTGQRVSLINMSWMF